MKTSEALKWAKIKMIKQGNLRDQEPVYKDSAPKGQFCSVCYVTPAIATGYYTNLLGSSTFYFCKMCLKEEQEA